MVRLIFFLILFSTSLSWAYPEFIGYGYASCLTCHFNGHGGGALNDYGRALWSAEIASRGLYSKSRTDESIAESSNFLGPVKTPWWIRPAIKYRGLWNNRSYGSRDVQTKFYHMQLDANLALQFDEDGKYLFYFTEGFRPNATVDPTKSPTGRMMAKEYFFRLKMGETYWAYFGLMDKVFGIRNLDHTSFTRIYQGLTQKDQSVGAIIHKVEDTWELSANVFTGNPDEEKVTKQSGGSLHFEKDTGEKQRMSLSYLNGKTENEKMNLYAIGYRMGMAKGSSIMTEFGVRQLSPLTGNAKTGSWGMLKGTALLTRGYLFQVTTERYNEEFKPSASDYWRWNLGFLMFPAPRIEIRTDLLSRRELRETGGFDDTWALQGQIHVSL